MHSCREIIADWLWQRGRLKKYWSINSIHLSQQRFYHRITWNYHLFEQKKSWKIKKDMTPTWFEHATFWSGVRRATVAPRSRCMNPKLSVFYFVNTNYYRVFNWLNWLNSSCSREPWTQQFTNEKIRKTFNTASDELWGTYREDLQSNGHSIQAIRKEVCGQARWFWTVTYFEFIDKRRITSCFQYDG